MNRAETATLLAMAAAYDQRTVGETDVLAWHAILEPFPFPDAQEAVTAHYTRTRDRLMPSDVVAGVRASRTAAALARHDEQVRREIAGPRPDAEEVARGVTLVREQLSIARGLQPAVTASDDDARRCVLAVDCPWCRAVAGAPCVGGATGGPLRVSVAHPSRVVAAADRMVSP